MQWFKVIHFKWYKNLKEKILLDHQSSTCNLTRFFGICDFEKAILKFPHYNIFSFPLLICFLKNQVGYNSSSTNWIFSLQKIISTLIFAGYTDGKNLVWSRLKIQFFKLDFFKLIFQKSSTDQQVDSGRQKITSVFRVFGMHNFAMTVKVGIG